MEFIIGQKLPTLNQYTNACRTHWAKGAKMKKEVEEVIGYEILFAKAKGTLKAATKPVIIEFTWFEPNKRRDKDNIASAKKFILDALVKNGILKNDGNKQVKGFTDTFVYGKESYVHVEIKEI